MGATSNGTCWSSLGVSRDCDRTARARRDRQCRVSDLVTSAEQQPPIGARRLVAEHRPVRRHRVPGVRRDAVRRRSSRPTTCCAANNQPWPPEGVELDVPRALVATLVLVASSFTLVASRPGRRAARRRAGDATWLLRHDRPRGGVPRQPAPASTRRSTSAPTTTRTARSTGCSPGSTAPTSRPGWRRWGCCSCASVRSRSHAAVASWAGGVSLFWHLVDLDLGLRVLDDLGDPVKRALPRRCRPRRRPSPGWCRSRRRRRRPAAPADEPTRRRALRRRSAPAATASTATGVEDRGPALTDEGPAAVDFVLRTGRMPMAEPNMQAKRGPVRYTRGGDRRPRRVRRCVRRRAGHPRRRPGGRRPRRRRRPVPAQLRRVPRRVGRRGGDRRRAARRPT